MPLKLYNSVSAYSIDTAESKRKKRKVKMKKTVTKSS
jgi:hypothetical protein